MARLPGKIRMRKEAEHTKAVVQCNHHRPFLRQAAATVGGVRSGASHKPATVKPDQDRAPLVRRLRRSPDVQVKAVFARWLELAIEFEVEPRPLRRRLSANVRK
jgi:hypothetical protein